MFERLNQNCEFWDELNQCCIYDRVERIVQQKYRDEQPAWGNPAACFDELD